MKKQKFQPKFVMSENGKPEAVLLDIKSYEALIEEVEDAHDIMRAEKVLAKKSKTHTLAEIKKSLLGKGK